MTQRLIQKIEEANLVGRGGAAYPTHLKWQAVNQAQGEQKYIICNASEGEIGLFKDIYILENYAETVVEGMILAMDYLGTKDAYFNFNKHYYKTVGNRVDKILEKYRLQGYKFEIFQEEPSYIGGEETALINAISGGRTEPRLKPPYPSDAGLFNKPTLVHNVETLYNIAQVNNDAFQDSRFYCISGEIKNRGVFHLPAVWSIKQILIESGNLPESEFFVQVGGSASGEVFNSNQISEEKVTGAGSIEVYSGEIPAKELLTKWFSFYNEESCGKCTPCRLGTFQLHNMVDNNKTIPWDDIVELLETLEITSFCALGKSVAKPVKSYIDNILKQQAK